MPKILFSALIIIALVLNGPAAIGVALGDTFINNGVIANEASFDDARDIKNIQHVSPYCNRLTDHANGYAITYPNHMWVDVSLSKVRTVIADNNTRIEIYRDDFTNTVHSPSGYISYSNKYIPAPENTVQVNRQTTINGLKAHVLQWQRAPLSVIDNDRNHYLSAEFTAGPKVVYTVLIKSSQPVGELMWIINSFKRVPIKGQALINKSYAPVKKDFNEETAEFYKKYFGSEADQCWGIFENSALYDINFLKSLENRLDYKFDFLVWYKSWGSDFPRRELELAYKNDKYVELSLQYPLGENLTYAILNGQYDEYLRKYAAGLKDFGHPVLFRLNNEMNGDWCSYSSLYTSKDTELFKAVWRHTYDIFKAAGVDNAVWVWNPNDDSFPGFQWNHALNYFPGEEYVDIIGLTGYNTGNYYPGEIWRDFDSIYRPLYAEYSQVFDYPFMITEFGCNSVGGDKNQWIRQMFTSLPNYPRIKVIIWFNGTDLDAQGKPARIYRLDESAATLEAFKSGLGK